jgi:endoglucanase
MRLPRISLFVAAALLLLSLPGFSQIGFAQSREDGVKIAFARAQHLRHGINVSHWFSQSPSDYSPHHTETETTPEDIQTIAKLGFDNVRLSIDALPLAQSFDARLGGHGQDNDFVARLDKAVDEILATGMAVTIDLHPEGPFKQAVKTSDEGVGRFLILWSWLASHYADRDPERVFFEVMNEPEVNDAYRWAGIQAHAVEVIRKAAPRQTIIATGANYSDIQDLLAVVPLADGNVIYNFHDYDPHEFTHQGATWGPIYWLFEKAIPYPVDESVMADRLSKIPDPVGRYRVKGYWLDHWDAHRIRLAIDSAAEWARANNVPLICNEFGVLRNVAEPADRQRWIHDMRTALEANGIGWAMWDYHNGFGVAVKDKDGKSVVDPGTVEALGLKK